MKKEIIKDETDMDYVISVRWLDGYFESFRARQIRISENRKGCKPAGNYIAVWDGTM
ncbi:hypothetical protein LCGC14_2973560, partial [marine sediment metagenome]